LPYADLREFIGRLAEEKEIVRISDEVNPELEITAYADRVCKAGGPALLFDKVKGSRMPVLVNLFGTEKRTAMALGVESLNDLGGKIVQLLATFTESPGTGMMDKLKMLPKLLEVSKAFPTVVDDGPAQEVVIEKDFSLKDIPILKCWPKDGGRFVTLPLVFTKDPDNGKRNCGVYRMQVFDATTTGMHWHQHKDGARHFRKYAALGKRMPVAVAVGPDPAVSFAGAVPMPPDVDEMILAGFLRGESVEMLKCHTVDVEVPANSEIVLEGYVDPAERRLEGPFGDHTGFYSAPDQYPVFHVTCITHRRNPIYQAVVVGRPPMEDCFMGLAIERLMLPLLKLQMPEIVDFHMPFEGVFHNLILVSIRKAYPGHARKVMHALWGAGQAMFSKVIVVVDEDVNVHDVKEVAWKVLNNIDPQRDTEFVTGPLDHASRLPCLGSKVGVDGTCKWKEEGFSREWPEELKMTPEIQSTVENKLRSAGIIR
jgi:4-hydroxy-3-polyprenylbenzoate decarboxylase